MIPKNERLSNALKEQTDAKAAGILGFNADKLAKRAKSIALLMLRECDAPKVVVCGGAGSGKTELTGELSKALNIPVFDLDKYIQGGWSGNREVYDSALSAAMYDLWSDLPSSGSGYIVEHVEACNPKMVKFLSPDFAIILDPGKEHVTRVANARNTVRFNEGREGRALSSMLDSKRHFSSVPGSIVMKDAGILVKKL